MKTYVQLRFNLSEFFLESKIFHTQVAEKINKNTFSKNRVVYEIM
jgi:EAL domain-containing protein (putative c-di-GMP-specific phosphodiesterase class I)